MTRLQIFVALESVVLLVLGVMWWSRVDVAPSESGSPSPASLAHSPAAETSAPLRSDDAAQVDRRELEPVTSAPALDPVLSICVAGTVRNERGEAIAGAWVGFENDERTESGRSTTSGAFVVSGLTRGAWDVRASAEGYAPIEERRELDDRGWQSVDLVLRPWIALPVRFVDREGRALAPESLVGHMGELQLLATEQPLAVDLPCRRSEDFGIGPRLLASHFECREEEVQGARRRGHRRRTTALSRAAPRGDVALSPFAHRGATRRARAARARVRARPRRPGG